MSNRVDRPLAVNTSSGLSLIEVLVAIFILGLVMTATISTLYQAQRLWKATDEELQGTGQAVGALQKIVSGYAGSPGLRMAEYASGVTPVTNSTGNRIDYTFNGSDYTLVHDGDTITNQDGVVLCEDVSDTVFTLNSDRPGTVMIDMTVKRQGAVVPVAKEIRLVTWVSLRNR